MPLWIEKLITSIMRDVEFYSSMNENPIKIINESDKANFLDMQRTTLKQMMCYSLQSKFSILYVYLRCLPQPLIPSSLYNTIIRVLSYPENERVEFINSVIQNLGASTSLFSIVMTMFKIFIMSNPNKISILYPFTQTILKQEESLMTEDSKDKDRKVFEIIVTLAPQLQLGKNTFVRTKTTSFDKQGDSNENVLLFPDYPYISNVLSAVETNGDSENQPIVSIKPKVRDSSNIEFIKFLHPNISKDECGNELEYEKQQLENEAIQIIERNSACFIRTNFVYASPDKSQ